MATINLKLAIRTPQVGSLCISKTSSASFVTLEQSQLTRGSSPRNSTPWSCSTKAMHSTSPAQSRRRNESLVCKSWFGGTKKTKSGVEASEEEEAQETKTKYSKLVLSLGVDAVGFFVDSSVLDFDFAWAPVAAFLIQRMYRSPLLTAVGFVEEAIPGVNFLPTATLGWLVETNPQIEPLVSKLPFMGGLGKGLNKNKDKDTPWWWPL